MGTMANDMLSFRRETMHGLYENIVPLLMYHEHLGPQAAVDRVGEMVHESYARFHEAEEALLGDDVEERDRELVERYLLACKDKIMCNLHWRYVLSPYLRTYGATLEWRP